MATATSISARRRDGRLGGETWRCGFGTRLARGSPPNAATQSARGGGRHERDVEWDRATGEPLPGTSYHLRVGTARRPGRHQRDDSRPTAATRARPGNQLNAFATPTAAPRSRHVLLERADGERGVCGVHAGGGGDFTVTGGGAIIFPTITTIGPQVTHEDTTTAPIAFTVDDAETPAEALRVEASSSDPALLPLDGFTFTGTGRERRLTANRPRTVPGVVWITLAVTDGAGQTTRTTFPLTVLSR